MDSGLKWYTGWKLPERLGQFSTWILLMGKTIKNGTSLQSIKNSQKKLQVSWFWQECKEQLFFTFHRPGEGQDPCKTVRQWLWACFFKGQLALKYIMLITVPGKRNSEWFRTYCSVVILSGTYVLTRTIAGILQRSVMYSVCKWKAESVSVMSAYLEETVKSKMGI